MSDSASAKKPHRWAGKLEEMRESYESRGKISRVLFVLTGAIVTLGGIAMLVLPGPALIVIPIGLTMLAMEFAWAERMLEKALEHAERASKSAQQASRGQRITAIAATVLGIAAVIAWALVGDIPVVPDP